MVCNKGKATIVMSSDDRYAPLLYELVRSIRDKPQSKCIDISVISAGMSPEIFEFFRATVDNLVHGIWDVQVSAHRMRHRKWLQGRSVKPYLPKYFPGYDYYLWIDADAWIADWRAVELMLDACKDGALAMAYDEVDDGYLPANVTWYLGRFPVIRTYCMKQLQRSHMPSSMMRKLAMAKPLNSGVYALAAEAPHWAVTQKYFEMLTRRGRIVGSNQMAFVMAVHLDDLPLNLVPAWCNFMGDPLVDAESGRLLMPYMPHEPVGIVHLAGRDHMRMNPGATITLADMAGGKQNRSLRYPLDWETVPPSVKNLLYAEAKSQ